MIPLFASLVFLPVRLAGADYSKTWAAVSGAITSTYYARRTRHDEMERLLAKYRPIASSATSRGAFEDAVNAMIAEFRDSHFAFFSKGDQGYYLMDSILNRGRTMPEFGAWFRATPGGFAVQMILDGGSAEKAGLRKGDLVQSIDGAKFSPVESLRGRKSAVLSVLRQGQSLTFSVEITEKTVTDMFLEATKASIKIIDDGPRKVGYIHEWTLLGDRFSRALSEAVTGRFAKTDAVILDLRDGFGGTPGGYADPFIPAAGTNSERLGYQKALVVLINEGSRSAKEVLAYNLRRSKRATLIGTTTAGNVLGTMPQPIEDWAYIEIPVMDVAVGGHRLEGVGVKPDITVQPEYDAAANDRILARALEAIKSMTSI